MVSAGSGPGGRSGAGVELGDDLFDLHAGGVDAAAAEADECGGPPDPLAQVVDVDGLALQLAEDPLQLGQGLGVAQLGRPVPPDGRCCDPGFSLTSLTSVWSPPLGCGPGRRPGW